MSQLFGYAGMIDLSVVKVWSNLASLQSSMFTIHIKYAAFNSGGIGS